MTLKYFYIAVLLLAITIGGYFFGKGLHSESSEPMMQEPPVQPTPDTLPEAETESPEPVHSENETIGGPFPTDVLPPEAIASSTIEFEAE